MVDWCLPYNDLFRAYDGSAVSPRGFADDTNFKIAGKDFETIFKISQWALNVAQKWANSIGVEFSAEKTAAMFFNRGDFRPTKRLKMGNQFINWSRRHKYLGIIIDDRLTFKPHVEKKIREAKRKLMVVRHVFQNTWGLL